MKKTFSLGAVAAKLLSVFIAISIFELNEWAMKEKKNIFVIIGSAAKNSANKNW